VIVIKTKLFVNKTVHKLKTTTWGTTT